MACCILFALYAALTLLLSGWHIINDGGGVFEVKAEEGECSSLPLLERIEVSKEKEENLPKVLCLIYSVARRKKQMQAQNDTWAPRCTKTLFLTDIPVPGLPTQVLKHDGEESYENMWQKLRAMYRYAYSIVMYHPEEYEWFYFGGDDVYLIVENLRAFLKTQEAKVPQIFGQPATVNKHTFLLGGPGYVMTLPALELLVRNLNKDCCSPKVVSAQEDVLVSKCMSCLDVALSPTHDEENGLRFHPLNPDQALRLRLCNPPMANRCLQTLKKENPNIEMPQLVKDVKLSLGFGWLFNSLSKVVDLQEGITSTSPSAAAFHYLEPEMMRKAHRQLYECRGSK
jgi:glycoprotein-N-acetylgalactosamine 3-beta-galactosyltransferase